MTVEHRRGVRSFVVRGGRMTDGQVRAHAQWWPKVGVAATDERLNLNQLFARQAPRTLEIGFGNGEQLARLAAAAPETDFLGVEVHPPGVGHLLLQVEALALSNVRIVQRDAVEVLQRQIPVESIDEILVLFPDPWHKKRHHKRRLINANFAALAASRLKQGGRLTLATDWAPYAEVMLDVLGAEPALRNAAAPGPFMPRDARRMTTRFERRGERLGHAVFDLAFIKQ